MNKSELIDSMAAKAGISKADTARALNAFVETVKETLASGDQISLVNFGTFLVRERAARTGLNPLTKEKLEIPEDALREILYNAIAHKDYTGAPIQMRVWDDHVDIWNEGELPEGYTQETLFARHSYRVRLPFKLCPAPSYAASLPL